MLKEIPKDLMYVYLAGIMLGGEAQKATVDWRYKIRQHYENYNGKGRYEISFLCPWNGEIDAVIDPEGLTNDSVSGNTIFQGDKAAIKKANLVVANFNQYGSARPSVGTYFECGMALAWDKPLILIVPENEFERWSKHPFTSQACAIFKSVDELLKAKILNWFYKRTNAAIYEWKL
jgi:hypothetical protein